jgi:ribosomal protein S18 acetylase RimI-like enzyme
VNAGFERHLASLVAVWEALRDASGGTVERGRGWVLARHPDPVFRNALLLAPDPAALRAVAGSPAVWTCAPDAAALVRDSGRSLGETSTAMLCALDAVEPPPAGVLELDPAPDLARVAALNGVAPAAVAGVRGLRPYLARHGGADAAALATFAHGDDVNVSFVATAPAARRRGLATALTAHALADARARGARTATLHGTPMAEALYRRLGFRDVGRGEEWV